MAREDGDHGDIVQEMEEWWLRRGCTAAGSGSCTSGTAIQFIQLNEAGRLRVLVDGVSLRDMDGFMQRTMRILDGA